MHLLDLSFFGTLTKFIDQRVRETEKEKYNYGKGEHKMIKHEL